MTQPIEPTASADDAKFVFQEWHRATVNRDVEALIALYAENAVMETPMGVLLVGTGLLSGHAAVARFLRANFAQRQTVIASMSAVRFYRTGAYQFDGRTLTWEYLRDTPHGDSFDVSEVLELRGRKIEAHRIYFGWFAFKSLLERKSG